MKSYKVYRPANRSSVVNLRNVFIGLGLVYVGFLVGTATLPSSEAWGEVRATPPPEAFKTGGQISVPILRDISATLRQIDARLARLEASAKQAQTDVATLATIAKQGNRAAVPSSP